MAMRAEPQLRHPTGEREPPEHRFNGDAATREATEAAPTTDDSADAARKKKAEREALKLLLQQFAELREYASFYAAARIDGAKASVRNAIIRMVLAALGFVAVAGLVVMASWLVLSGAAQGLGTLFGDQSWIGTLLTGLAALAGVGAGVQCVAAVRRKNARKRTVEKYEARQAQQRTRFGRDAHGREPPSFAQRE